MSNTILSGTIETNDKGNYSELICPRCKSANLHHLGVKAFLRLEDKTELLEVVVDGEVLSCKTTSSKNSENSSSRRDGLAIPFSCEGCCDNSEQNIIELTIAQHKGATHIGWRYSQLEK